MANELCIPPDITPESPEQVELVDDQTVLFKPQFSRRWTQRNSFGDPYWQFTRRYRGLRQKDRTRMRALIAEAQGGFRTIMVSPAQSPAGTWVTHAGGEILTDPTFTSAANFTPSAQITHAVSESVYRGTLNSNVSASTDLIQAVAGTTTQYAPYVQRWGYRPGTYPFTGQLRFRGPGALGTAYETSLTNPSGYLVYSYVTESTATIPVINSGASANSVPGMYFDITFGSMSRCFLVDGGGCHTLRSDELNNAAWTKTRTTTSTDSHTAPDGTVTGDRLIEDGSNNTHIVFQSASRTSEAKDLIAHGYFFRSTGTRNLRLIVGNDSSNYSACNFDLGAVTAGTVTNVGTSTNGRAFIYAAGSGWYYCAVIARQAAAATIYIQAGLLNGTTESYAGDSTSALGVWRFGGTVSQVVTRGAQTTAAAVASSAQSGSSLYVKGLPASQNGLLLAGDWVEIDGQLKQLTASLDSNPAGLGHLQVRPYIYREVADNTPIIVTKPMGRFMLGSNAKYSAMFGQYNDFDQLVLNEIYE